MTVFMPGLLPRRRKGHILLLRLREKNEHAQLSPVAFLWLRRALWSGSPLGKLSGQILLLLWGRGGERCS